MFDNFPYDDVYFQQLITTVSDTAYSDTDERNDLNTIFGCIDNTSLNSTDSASSVTDFCRRTFSMQSHGVPPVAAVCVFPLHVETARKALGDSPIHVASVAGGFPAGQLPISLKTSEVRYVVEHGADEVDIVVDRGAFLEGNEQKLFDEVAAAKEACGHALLKVILETGELLTPQRIYRASMLAMLAGADFIKTSTGKISVGATPLSATVMLTAVRDFVKNNKKNIGFKAAGGLSNLSDALLYLHLTKKILDSKNINNHLFRIGTSRLTPQLFNFLTNR